MSDDALVSDDAPSPSSSSSSSSSSSLVSHRCTVGTIILSVFSIVILLSSLFFGVVNLSVNLFQFVVPLVPIIAWFYPHRNFTSLNYLLFSYQAGIVTGFCMGVCQVVITLLGVFAAGVSNFVLMMVVLSPFCMLLPEEALKYYVSRRAAKISPAARATFANTIYTVSGSCGFGVGLCVVWAGFLSAGFATRDWYGIGIRSVVGLLMCLWVVPIQTVTAWFIDLRVALCELVQQQQHASVADAAASNQLPQMTSIINANNIPSGCLKIILPSIGLRWVIIGVCLLSSLSFVSKSSIDSTWYIPLIVCTLVSVVGIVVGAVMVKRQERNMPRDYLLRVGHLNAFGYGELRDADEAEMQQQLQLNAASPDQP